MQYANETIIIPVVEYFRGLWEDVSGFFSDLWRDIKDIWRSVSGWFNENIITPVTGAFKTACEAMGGFFNKLWSGIKGGVVGAMNAVIGGIESAINFIVGGINNIIGGFNKVVSWAEKVAKVDWGGVDLVPTVSIPRIPAFATGGLVYTPTVAQIGEAGKKAILPLTNKSAMRELVGEITSSAGISEYGGYDNGYFRQIEEATYRGTMKALAQWGNSNNSSGDISIQMNLDGDVVYNSMVKKFKERRTRADRFVLAEEVY